LGNNVVMARKVRVLGVQINSVIGDKVKNYQKVSTLLRENAWFKPDLIVLPEVFNTGVDHKRFEELAEPVPDQTTMFLSGFAEQFNSYIVGGSFIEKCPDGKFRNASLVFDRTGKIVAKYHKIHMFSYYGSHEGEVVSSGDRAVVVETDFGKLGLSICYDLRFPELYRTLAYAGAEILVCPAAWPYPRYDHWITLNKARAVENLCYMVSVNQCDQVTLSRTNVGQSMIVNPWGEIIASAGSKEGVLMAEIDLDEIERIRKEFPVLDDRKPEAYKI